MNKRYVVRLSDAERAYLEALASKGKANARKIVHAQILMSVDAAGLNWTDEAASKAFRVHTNTVCTIRERFVLDGLEAALVRKKQCRPSNEPKLDGAGEARLTALACSAAPEGRVRWTLHLLANKLVELKVVDSISHETVRRALKKTS